MSYAGDTTPYVCRNYWVFKPTISNGFIWFKLNELIAIQVKFIFLISLYPKLGLDY